MKKRKLRSLPPATAVFINCPFDPAYRAIFDAIVFAVCAAGSFVPKCALDQDSGSKERLTKILELIDECPYGIHDLSYMGLDPKTELARHNMPFELGLFLGCEFSNQKLPTRRRSRKSCLILDSERYRYQRSISDLGGRDIKAHDNTAEGAIAAVRDWLATESGRNDVPGTQEIVAQYGRFRKQAQDLCKQTKREFDQLTFREYRELVSQWLRQIA